MVKGEIHTNNSCKLKIFGFELDPCKPPVEINHKIPHENDQEISPLNSSSNSTVSSQKEEEPPMGIKSQQMIRAEEKGKEFVCEYCYKRFANSQALGGHQNAHKKERMRKKRLQLQATTASINYYLQQPFQLPNEQVYNYVLNSSNFTIFSDESLHSDHHQISFSSSSYGGHDLANYGYGYGYGYGPIIQQNPCKFSLTHVENSNQSKYM